MNPVVIVAPILGNICAIAFYSIFNIGLKGPSSPGSIIAFLSMQEKLCVHDSIRCFDCGWHFILGGKSDCEVCTKKRIWMKLVKRYSL